MGSIKITGGYEDRPEDRYSRLKEQFPGFEPTPEQEAEFERANESYIGKKSTHGMTDMRQAEIVRNAFMNKKEVEKSDLTIGKLLYYWRKEWELRS